MKILTLVIKQKRSLRKSCAVSGRSPAAKFSLTPSFLLRTALCGFLLSCSLFSASLYADKLDSLLENVKKGSLVKSQEALDAEKQFSSAADKQSLVSRLRTERSSLERASESLEQQFKSNEESLDRLRTQREVALGDLSNLFGLVEQAAGEAKATFDSSIITAQYPKRVEAMDAISKKVAQSNTLLSIDEIEKVWQELLNEMVQQGNVVNFQNEVATSAGARESSTVTRVGSFNLVGNGKFLEFGPGGISELARQPSSRFLSQTQELQNASGGMVNFAIDPTRGALLGAAVETPSLMERVHQGGIVGYIILAVGLIAVLYAIFKIFTLMLTGSAVDKQAANAANPDTSNPLGRVLSILGEHSGNASASNTDALEMKLSEAIMSETPKLNSGLMFLKIVSVVAPLAGLLGTVLGMIQTFQAITLFGAGDPKLMAGGISQALVTTVCGLVVAIPVVLLHTAAASRAKRIEEVLEEQATGMVARQLENP